MLRYCYIFFTSMMTYGQVNNQEIITVNHIEGILDEAYSVYKKDVDSALNILKSIQSDIRDLDNARISAYSNVLNANILWYKKEYASSIKLLQLNLKKQKNLSPDMLGKTYRSLGDSYRQQRRMDSAFPNYILALKYFQEAENTRGISLTYLSIGMAYGLVDNKEMASKFFNQSLAYSDNSEVKKMHEKHLVDNDTIIGWDYHKFIDLSTDIAQLATDQKDYRLVAITYGQISEAYTILEDYDNALDYIERTLRIKEQINSDSRLDEMLVNAARLYQKKQNPKRAITYYKKALEVAGDSIKLDIYKGLRDAYYKTGNSKEALSVMDAYVTLKDTLEYEKVKTSIAEITTKYQTELQDEQIEKLNVENELQTTRIGRQRVTLFGIVIGSGLLLSLSFLGYKNYKWKQELTNTQLNFRLLQTQMNPHFMFNALNVINTNLQLNPSEKSSKYLTAYSSLMRNVLKSSTREFITIAEDIQLISKFLELQQLMHHHEFTFEIFVSEMLEKQYVQIPPMLTQPIIENAVLHGVRGIKNGHISISYQLNNDDMLIVEIKDNGYGIKSKQQYSGNELHDSISTQITDERIETYKKLYNYTILLKTTSIENKGTVVTFVFPLKTKIV